MLKLWSILFVVTIASAIVIAWPVLRKKRLNFPACLGLALFALIPLTLYRYWGASDQLAEAKELQQQVAKVKQEIQQLGSRQAIIAELEARVKKTPKQAKGWYLLAKLYLNGGEQEKSLTAMQQAQTLDPDNPQYWLGVVTIRFVKSHHLNNNDKTLLRQVLAKQANNINALNLFAIDAYHQHHYDLALQYWQKILSVVPADSDDAAHIRNMMTQAAKASTL